MFEQLFGSMVAGGFDHGMRDTTVVNFVEQMPDYSPAYKNGHVWFPTSRAEIQVSTRWHRTEEDARIELYSMLASHGYEPPKLWQWWRWKEKRLRPALAQ